MRSSHEPMDIDAGPAEHASHDGESHRSRELFDIRRALAVWPRLPDLLRTSPAGGESDPNAPEPAVVLGPIKKWPGNQATRGDDQRDGHS